jgi:hypothetical protein
MKMRTLALFLILAFVLIGCAVPPERVIIVTATPTSTDSPPTPTATEVIVAPTLEPTPTRETYGRCFVGTEIYCGEVHMNPDMLGNVRADNLNGRTVEIPGLFTFAWLRRGNYSNAPFSYCKDYNKGCRWEIHNIDGAPAYCSNVHTYQHQRYLIKIVYTLRRVGVTDTSILVRIVNPSGSIGTWLTTQAGDGQHEALWVVQSEQPNPSMNLCVGIDIAWASLQSGSFITWHHIGVEAVPDDYGDVAADY